MKSPRKPNEDDRRLGAELRALRRFAGLSQAEAAARLGVSTQQYGKYERGENRIPARRLETARRMFPPDRPVVVGLAEEGAPYDAGPPSSEHFQREWDRLKKQLDRLFTSLIRAQR